MHASRPAAVAAALLVGLGAASAVPAGLAAKTLTNADVAVPDDLPAGALLIVGFSRGSNAQTEPWRKRVDADAALEPLAYSVLVLEGAPRWVRGLIVRGVRRAVPEEQHDSVLVVTQDGDAWRAWVGFEAESQDAAYVLRIDGLGGTCFRYVGAVSDDALLAGRNADCVAGDEGSPEAGRQALSRPARTPAIDSARSPCLTCA